MLVIYITTLFVSAALLFLVQPMFGKMVVPLLGGSPTVWNTEVVFCQGILLLGYLYSHATVRWLGVRRQALVQCFLVFLPLLVLPIGIEESWSPPAGQSPLPWLFSVLLVCLGLPFFVVATTGPMLQRWFACTRHPKASDPYFLYAAGNAGSMSGLLGYPLLLEPYFQLQNQSTVWGAGYGALILLTLTCAVILLRSPQPTSQEESTGAGCSAPSTGNQRPIPGWRRLRWVLCAFAPSSLMLSVTTYLSTNIAPVPLLWVIPLAIYLLSFILVFARTALVPHRLVIRSFPVASLALLMVIILQATQPIWFMIPIHLICFFVIAMMCHGVLANDRPAVTYLTEFYLWVSLGGILGGAFNVVLAPVVFSSLLEYPLVLVLAALSLAWPQAGWRFQWGWLDLVFPVSLAVAGGAFILLSQVLGLQLEVFTFGVLALFSYLFSRRALRLGLGLGAVLLASVFYTGEQGRVLYKERDFFGVHRVQVDAQEEYHILVHSGTLHGRQSLQVSRRCEPLSYYHPTGPLGQLFAAFDGQSARYQVAAVGLGAGSMAGYNKPGQHWTFFEIDPTVVRIASDPRYFTYLTGCGGNIRIVLGDARLSLAKEPRRRFDLLILDAYSSDSIPLHLVTREAFDLYLDKITERGTLVFHVSNQYLDLKPALGNLAQDAGLVSLVQDHFDVSERQRKLGQEPSQWIVMSRKLEYVQELARDRRWRRLEGSAEVGIWTDSYSSILSLLQWRVNRMQH